MGEPGGPWHAGGMDVVNTPWIVRLARRAGHGVLKIHVSMRHASALLFSYGLAETNRAPDTYAEFLLRCRVASRHEPTAHGRAAGRPVK
jgi:hypothetical protein